MQVNFTKYALDRIPICLIIDDSAPLVNLNYFWLRDRIKQTGEMQRWEDIPAVIPESFTREFGEWCAENGVKGKYSVVPCPAGLGRIDEGLPLYGKEQIDSWLDMCREVYMPNFDITPEMLTHSFVLDLKTLKPVDPPMWEQFEWAEFHDLELIVEYIKLSCKILDNVGLTPPGVTSPGGFGHKCLDLYAKAAGIAVREVTGKKTPYFFQRVITDVNKLSVPVWHIDRDAVTAVGEIIACAGDWTGSWTGYGEVSVDKYITEDLKAGKLAEAIDAGAPCVMVSHWQGFYGMHNDDRRGFKAFKEVVRRLKERDPHNDYTQWKKVSDITDYSCAKEFGKISVDDNKIYLDLPLLVPDITLTIQDASPSKILFEGIPLKKAASRKEFVSGTFYQDDSKLLLAVSPQDNHSVIEIL